jgi:hypothetical protein
MTPTELWLPVGAAAFYVYDSACLLWQNELLYEKAGAGWRVAGGSQLRLMGRRLQLPNPLLPQRALFLVRWSPADARQETQDATALQRMLDSLRPVRMLVVAMMLLLLAAVPLVSWILGAGLTLLLIFGAYYLCIIGALMVVYCRRDVLRLTGKSFWLLAFDVLACAPFAVNLVRKITLRYGIGGDPTRFAAMNFERPLREKMLALIRARLDEQFAEAPATDQQQQLSALMLARLAEGVPCTS